MFSVVIPLYNKDKSIGNTIQSVLNQTFVDFEVVIVNDGSTDNSLSVVQQFDDPRIKVIDKPNGGVSSARNRGIEEASNEWIAFLDGDDLWKENHLEVLYQLIIKFPEDKVFCTSFIRSNQSFPKELDESVLYISDYFVEAIKRHFFWTSVTCIHITVFSKVGVFDTKFNRGEDLDLWARIGIDYAFVKSNTVTAIYRIEAENRSDLSFDLATSRIYNYNFSSSSRNSEYIYYKKQIVNLLKSFLLKRSFKNFFLLKKKHKRFVSYIDILRF